MAKTLRQPGFTFIEVLIALSLFTIALVSILQIFPVNRRFLAQSAFSSQASFVAQDEIEAVRAQTYDSLTPIGSSPAYEPLHYVSTTTGDPLSQYQRQTVITYVNPASSPSPYVTTSTDSHMKKVDVTVYWKENGNARQRTISTYVYDK